MADVASGVPSADQEAENHPELVVLVVSALGTTVAPVQAALESAFRSVGYEPRKVRISELLSDAHEQSGGPPRPLSTSEPEWLMNLGDNLRAEVQRKDAAALLAMLEIRRQRAIDTGTSDHDEAAERPKVVTIVRSAKRAEEIEAFRLIYGSRLLVVGVSSLEVERRENLLARLQREHHDQPELAGLGEADRLLARDEADDNNPVWGQGLRKAFSKADAFVWLRAGRQANDEIKRLVDLWFGQPFGTPTRDEQGMFYATAAQFRSAAAGRQVGAAVVDRDGEVLVTGTNDVPKPHGGQYWTGDDPDHRDFTLEFETNDVGKRDVAIDVLGRLADAKWLKNSKRRMTHASLADVALSKGGPLQGSRISDLIEFGRIMHAEMAAICTAARRGTPIGGSTLYTTTYPCHECTRLLIGVGIKRVVYIDPYPKSQVKLLFQNLVTDDADGSRGKVLLVPFEGVGPDLYPYVFQINQRGRDTRGTFEVWQPRPLAAWGPDLRPEIVTDGLAMDVLKNTPFGQAWLGAEREA